MQDCLAFKKNLFNRRPKGGVLISQVEVGFFVFDSKLSLTPIDVSTKRASKEEIK